MDKTEYLREYRRKNAAILAAKDKERYDKNRDKILAQKREYTARTVEQRKARAKIYYELNKPRILAEAKKQREGKKETLAQWQRDYRKKNLELIRARDLAYYQAHRDRKLLSKSSWGKTEHGRIQQKAKNQARRSRKNEVVSALTSKDLKELIKLSKGKCFYCGMKKKLSLDHIVPISKGGSHTKDNVVMACISCNSSKGAKDPFHFAASRGLLLI